MDAVRVQDLCFRYFPEGKRNVLDHVDLSVPEGGITVLTGDSGCGKSTLAAVIAGLYPEHGGVLVSGTAELFGVPVHTMTPKERAQTISMMFQEPSLQFCMDTLRKELFFCMENLCLPPENMQARLEQAAARLDLTAYLDRKLHTLSGGEQQKAALCCLLVLDSRIFVLDEAFANIDAKTAKEIIAFLRRLADEGKTILAIDHRRELWQDAADRFLCLTQEPELPAREKQPCSQREDAIVLQDVTICRDAVLLDHACASFPKGCMSVILGECGSGKTTLFLSLLKQHSYEGSIFVNGQDLRKIKPKALYEKMGVVFQKPSDQFITQNVLTQVRSENARQLLESYDLWQYRNYSPYMLSQGQQRRLAVLSVLAGGQQILLLDEPTYGQDARCTAAIMEQLQQKMAEGLTVICITHDEALAHTWADRIYRLEGRKLHAT